ncbi:hypothetical protein Pmar_PMAR003926 [Perkinsus marinus ATCC 50983]|uniref:Uncharacterized protein n=1 Tax=Perkinsus marinus (strain ATCC 50983 / TXsc) TaxID=423536 RepID=C5LTU5_PERM5|nr:hypothetical protein Pmar_PMAR003926 [Perkinsus marinus ATCC 50983]EEQ99847.1 hypothetical protein Pmar_PMAR003926 [Perkinsus marinus ATCC 50983]|eukprot:XP_002767130.1 hypothetical protein Pmar_PMAR003926 [Perkinsus marinus ATCC 50983]
MSEHVPLPQVARFANKLPEEPTPVENKVGDVAQAAKLTAAAAAEKGSFLVIGEKAHESESTKASNSGSPSAKSRKKNCDPRAYTKDKPYQPCYQPDWVDPKMPETKH